MDIILAWIASIASAIIPIVIKISSNSVVKDPWIFNVLWVTSAIPLVFLYALYLGGGIPTDWVSILYTSASLALFLIFYTLALFKINVSTIAPLFSLRMIFAALLGVYLLNESLDGISLILIILIIIASPFATYHEGFNIRSFWNKYILLCIISMFFLALNGYFTAIAVQNNGFATAILWQDFVTLILLLPTLLFAKINRFKYSRATIKPFIFIGISAFAYIVSATEAFSRNLTLTSIIISLPLSMIFAVFLGKYIKELQENHPKKTYLIRFAAASIMVTSAIIIGIL